MNMMIGSISFEERFRDVLNGHVGIGDDRDVSLSDNLIYGCIGEIGKWQ